MYAEKLGSGHIGGDRQHICADKFELQQLTWLLEEKGWSLPSSYEFEWAVRGRMSTLFHWGDTQGKFVRNEMVNGQLGELKWPYCNRFGLNSPLDCTTWCQPGKGKEPIISRGGAAWASPWQNCDEWVTFLTAVHERSPIVRSLGMRFWAGVRPVIRIGDKD